MSLIINTNQLIEITIPSKRSWRSMPNSANINRNAPAVNIKETIKLHLIHASKRPCPSKTKARNKN
ncbi:MAG: hypothetical protein P8107_13890, partial [Spirochaetia bacterium]